MRNIGIVMLIVYFFGMYGCNIAQAEMGFTEREKDLIMRSVRALESLLEHPIEIDVVKATNEYIELYTQQPNLHAFAEEYYDYYGRVSDGRIVLGENLLKSQDLLVQWVTIHETLHLVLEYGHDDNTISTSFFGLFKKECPTSIMNKQSDYDTAYVCIKRLGWEFYIEDIKDKIDEYKQVLKLRKKFNIQGCKGGH